MLGKLIKRKVYGFKEREDPSCKSNVVAPQNWARLGCTHDVEAVGSGGLNTISHGNTKCHILLES